MNFLERVMRVMTHINIGAGLGLMAWVLWTGWQVATGQITPSYSAAEVRALRTLAHAGHAAHVAQVATTAHAAHAGPMGLQPVMAGSAAPPPCHESQPVEALKGSDL